MFLQSILGNLTNFLYLVQRFYWMDIKLKSEPQNVTIISGFPGFGMVGTIATEFLIEHLDTQHIGRAIIDKMPAVLAIHEGQIVEPLAIYHNKDYNLVIVHSIFGQPGTEWRVCDVILELSKRLKAKEIISLEGVGTGEENEESRSLYFTTNKEGEKKFKDAKMEKLNEGIIMGVTSALLMQAEGLPITCIFAETHSNLPDSKAAAKIVEALDVYLNLSIDSKPLLEMAEKFENKLRKIMQESKMAETQRDKKALSYVG